MREKHADRPSWSRFLCGHLKHVNPAYREDLHLRGGGDDPRAGRQWSFGGADMPVGWVVERGGGINRQSAIGLPMMDCWVGEGAAGGEGSALYMLTSVGDVGMHLFVDLAARWPHHYAGRHRRREKMLLQHLKPVGSLVVHLLTELVYRRGVRLPQAKAIPPNNWRAQIVTVVSFHARRTN